MYSKPSSSSSNQQRINHTPNSAFPINPPVFDYSPFGCPRMCDPHEQPSGTSLPPSSTRSNVSQMSSHPRQSSQNASLPTPMTSTPSTSHLGFMAPAQPSATSWSPMDRTLPSKQVDADNIADAYVSFILYCNPNFPLDVDTSTLKNNFLSPPRSDSKDFQAYRLFELISKFDAKEIKTWGQLALDLGVEPPDVSKGQSMQKVQQYSVRLKRWMRAMHVDAFFEYLLGKQHSYFIEIPDSSSPYPPGGRDGVVAEEDLAIRALDPAFRPKRGRRRNSETELDEESIPGSGSKPAKPMDGGQKSAMTAIPSSAMPMSGHPDAFNDPWTAASATTSAWPNKQTVPQSAVMMSTLSQFRWQLHGNPQEATTPHPMTAHPISRREHLEADYDAPKSAVTPSSRKKRKHGPAVSSAWSSANGSGAKPRGRPPANRNTQDGPFTTFPVEPGNAMSNTATQAVPQEEQPLTQEPTSYGISEEAPPSWQNEGPSRPGRLSLQVPEHTGAPVRLATPPRVLVNGERNESGERVSSPPRIQNITSPPPAAPPPSAPPTSQPTVPGQSKRRIRDLGDVKIVEREFPGFAYEVLKRVLASDLLRAKLVGRKRRLSGEEARALAEAVLDRLAIPRADTDGSQHDIARLTAASWLGLGCQLRVPLGPAIGQDKKITVARFRVDAAGYEEPVPQSEQDEDEAGAGAGARVDADPSASSSSGAEIRESFDLSWTVTLAGCTGSFELKALALAESPTEPEDEHDHILRTWCETVRKEGISDERASAIVARGRRLDFNPSGHPVPPSHAPEDAAAAFWRSKYMEMVLGAKMARGELVRAREDLIEKVLDVLIQ